eukprot:m.56054 g.56054  ORF g.56054 m.56054 type:complete len:1922 (+) comp7782_c0_seq1:62-5827(+)
MTILSSTQTTNHGLTVVATATSGSSMLSSTTLSQFTNSASLASSNLLSSKKGGSDKLFTSFLTAQTRSSQSMSSLSSSNTMSSFLGGSNKFGGKDMLQDAETAPRNTENDGIFGGRIFCLDGMKQKDKSSLTKAIKGNGGTTSGTITEDVDCLLVWDHDIQNKSFKMKVASKKGVPVVLATFVYQSIDAKYALPIKDFLCCSEKESLLAHRITRKEVVSQLDPMHDVERSWLSVDLNDGRLVDPIVDKELPYHVVQHTIHHNAASQVVFTLELQVRLDGSTEEQKSNACDDKDSEHLHLNMRERSVRFEDEFVDVNDELPELRVYIHQSSSSEDIHRVIDCTSYRHAEVVFSTLDIFLRNAQFQPVRIKIPFGIGSPHLRKSLEHVASPTGENTSAALPIATRHLIIHTHMDARNKLEESLSTPFGNVTLMQIDEAVGVLVQIAALIRKLEMKQLQTPKKRRKKAAPKEGEDMEEWQQQLVQWTKKYYSVLPRSQHDQIQSINTLLLVAQEQEICELVRSMAVMHEMPLEITNGDKDFVQLYRALNCKVRVLDDTSAAFVHLKSEVGSCLENPLSFIDEESGTRCEGLYRVEHVYGIDRIDADVLTSSVGNKKLLYHATPAPNAFSVLARGLLLPEVAARSCGSLRRDPGKLGRGIYFGAVPSTSLQYTTQGSSGRVYLFVAEVKVGKSYHTKSIISDWTQPPHGYDSVIGDVKDGGDFSEEEIVVYNEAQQRIKFIVQLCPKNMSNGFGFKDISRLLNKSAGEDDDDDENNTDEDDGESSNSEDDESDSDSDSSNLDVLLVDSDNEVSTSSKSWKVPLNYNTAVVVCFDDDVSSSIQTIRQQHDKKHVDIWPAHLTLLYPFVHDTDMDAAMDTIEDALDQHMEPFTVRLSRFDSFNRGRRGHLTYLGVDDPKPLQRLHSVVQSALGGEFMFSSLDSPHITVGRDTEDPLSSILHKKWTPLESTIASVVVLRREQMGKPMCVVRKIDIPLPRSESDDAPRPLPWTSFASNNQDNEEGVEVGGDDVFESVDRLVERVHALLDPKQTGKKRKNPFKSSDLQNLPQPLDTVMPGLQSTSGDPLPLRSVHVRGRVVDMIATCTAYQTYINTSAAPIEAKYVFPLDESAAVCGFEAFINDKHVVGEVKEKEQARREYKKAIEEGHGAYLMEEEEKAPNVFTVSVGNLPPQARVVIKISFLMELAVEDRHLVFKLPGAVSSSIQDKAADHALQTTLGLASVVGGDDSLEDGCSIQLSIDMPSNITNISCPSHKDFLKVKRTDTKATIEVSDLPSLDEGFTLDIDLDNINAPRMWVEESATKGTRACMLAFYPEIDSPVSDVHHHFIVDLSSSMKGNLQDTINLCLLCVEELRDGERFNITVFGDQPDTLFPCYVSKSWFTHNVAASFLCKCTANLGATNIDFVVYASLLRAKAGLHASYFLITDGEFVNPSGIVSLLQSASPTQRPRFFCFGVGSMCNKHALRKIAQASFAAAWFPDSKRKSTWQRMVRKHLNYAKEEVLQNVEVQWHQHGEESPPVLQAPHQLGSIFSGQRQLVYGFAENCESATLKGRVGDKEFTTMVSVSPIQMLQGEALHKLTARGLIREWTSGLSQASAAEDFAVKEKQKQEVINMSIDHSIVTEYTSFIAVEKRKIGEDMSDTGPPIEELLGMDPIDQLPYISFSLPPILQRKVEKERGLDSKRQHAKSVMYVNQELAATLYKDLLPVVSELDESNPVRLKLAYDLAVYATSNDCSPSMQELLFKNALRSNNTIVTALAHPKAKSILTGMNVDNVREEFVDSAMEWNEEQLKLELMKRREEEEKKLMNWHEEEEKRKEMARDKRMKSKSVHTFAQRKSLRGSIFGSIKSCAINLRAVAKEEKKKPEVMENAQLMQALSQRRIALFDDDDDKDEEKEEEEEVEEEEKEEEEG